MKKIHKKIALLAFFALLINLVSAKDDISTYISKAKYYQCLNEDSCLYYCDLVYPMTVSANNLEKEAEILLLKSAVLKSKGYYEEASGLQKRIKNIAQKTGNRIILGDALSADGSLYLVMGIFDASYSSLMEALKIYKSEKYNIGIARVYNNLGVMSGQQGNFDEALKYFKKANESIQNAKDSVFEVILQNNISLIHINQGDYEKAEIILSKTLKKVTDLNIPYSPDRLYLSLSRMYIDLKKYDTAIEQAANAYTFGKKAKNELAQARALYYIGYIYLMQEKHSEALRIFDSADIIAVKFGITDIHCQIQGHKAELYEEMKDYPTAYICAIAYKRASDSLNSLNNLSNLSRLKYEYEYKEQLAQKDYKAAKRTWLFIGISISLVFVIFIFFLIYSRQKLRLKNTELERKALSLQLEQRNKEITTKTIYIQQKNDIILSIADKLFKAKHLFKAPNQEVIEESIKLLKQCATDNSWEEFEMRFENVHTDFFKKLYEKFPTLTPNEKKLCAYLRLNMSTKEMAILTHTSVGGVEQARFRLRKKLGLHNSEQDLNSFIENL